MNVNNLGKSVLTTFLITAVSCAEPQDAVETSESAIRKGRPGAESGQGDFCSDPTNLCTFGEGDCDSNAQCAAGTNGTPGLCLSNNGGRYPNSHQLNDHCAPASCNNRVQDGALADVPAEDGIDCSNTPGHPCGSCAPTCTLASGADDRCSYHCPCAERDGDCDTNEECIGGVGPGNTTVCARDAGARFGMPATHDVCLALHCVNGLQDVTETGVDCGDLDCGACSCANVIQGSECTPACPCTVNQGDCDSKNDCISGLVCLEGGLVDRCNYPANASPFGNGADGALTLNGVGVDLSVSNQPGRSCADGGDMVSYSVSALGTWFASLSTAPSAGCLAAGDEVVLINLQGSPGSSANTGAFETLRVFSVDNTRVRFAMPKTRFYGEGATNDQNLGVTSANQRVMLQRVPNYSDVLFESSGVQAAAFDGVRGGLMAFRVSGALLVSGATIIDMSGRGYRGAPRTFTEFATGFGGESLRTLGAQVQTANDGGGGGGTGEFCASYGSSGGGGGFAGPGLIGNSGCNGAGGNVYGDADLGRLYLGSGGGSGGNDNVLFDNPAGGFGGAGGGAIYIAARTFNISGGFALIISLGDGGQGDLFPGCFGGSTTDCWDYSGAGGGGAGGSIRLFGESVDLSEAGSILASGGAGGFGGSTNGGDGGEGRIAIDWVTSFSPGPSNPAANAINRSR